MKYAHRKPVQGSYAARTMRWGGVIILLFVVYHILDLTTGTLNPVGDPDRPYAQVVAGFALDRWYVTLFYVARHGGARLPPAARHLQRDAHPRPADPGR